MDPAPHDKPEPLPEKIIVATIVAQGVRVVCATYVLENGDDEDDCLTDVEARAVAAAKILGLLDGGVQPQISVELRERSETIESLGGMP